MIFDATARPDRRVGEYPGGVSSNSGEERPPVFFGGPQNGGFAYYREPKIKKLKFTDKISQKIAVMLIGFQNWEYKCSVWEYYLIAYITETSKSQCERHARGMRLWGRKWSVKRRAYDAAQSIFNSSE